MATGLAGTYWADKYKKVLLTEHDSGVSSTATTIIDGSGNETQVKISTNGLEITSSGSIKVGSNTGAISQDSGGGVKLLSTEGNLVLQASDSDDVVYVGSDAQIVGDTYLDGNVDSNNATIDVVKEVVFYEDINVDVINPQSGSTVTIEGSVFSEDLVTVDEVKTDSIVGKTSSSIIKIADVAINGKTSKINSISAIDSVDVTIDDSLSVTGEVTIATNLSQTTGTSALKAVTATTISASGDITASGTNGVKTNVIAERTSGNGVTVDGVLLKDSSVSANSVKVDTLNASSGSTITVDDELVINDGIGTDGTSIFIDAPTLRTNDIEATSIDSPLSTYQPVINSATSAPSTTPTKIGDIFINTATPDFYIATGTSSSSDWKKVTIT